METVVETPPPNLSGFELVRLYQGFSCVFWGLPVGLLFCVQLLVLDVVVADPGIRTSLSHLYFCLFLAVLALVSFGALKLVGVQVIGDLWRRRARICLLSSLLSLYFSPFLYWWRARPEETLYTLNLFCLIISVIAFLVSLNFLSMELGRFLSDHSLRKESKLFLGLNALVLAVPSSGAFAWAAIRSRRLDSTQSLGLEFLGLFRLYYTWRLALFIILFLPISLTLANLWRVKEILLEELKKLPGKSSPSNLAG